MNGRIAIVSLLLVLAAVLGAGCTQTPPGVTPTPTPPITSTPVTTTPPPVTTTLGSLTPGPTVTMPPQQQVEVDVIRNPVTANKEIDVIFQGGSGQSATVRVDVTITRDDGSTETKYIDRPAPSESIPRGAEVTFNGSDRDRVEVTVWLNTGLPYKIIDQVYTQQTRP